MFQKYFSTCEESQYSAAVWVLAQLCGPSFPAGKHTSRMDTFLLGWNPSHMLAPQTFGPCSTSEAHVITGFD